MRLLVFFETDCPTCRLLLPYLKNLPGVHAISQDDPESTRVLVEELRLPYEVIVDQNLELSRRYDPEAVPALFLVDDAGNVLKKSIGFDKKDLNELAAALGAGSIAPPYDGNPDRKPGCESRHREMQNAEFRLQNVGTATQQLRASRIEVADADEWYPDPLPVIPPTVERVDRMLAAVALDPAEVIARVPPNYGVATVEKIAANAVMAGCKPEMMRMLIPLMRAACDERFNLHGVQATTHFAAPLVIVNGPVRRELGFTGAGNVFSNVARANSTLGRAFQLILTNLGGARPGEIDMSTLGNPGKFSFVIAENEEENPWEPFHVERGLPKGSSAITLFAAEPPRGVSEHQARSGSVILKAICRALATVWTYRACIAFEALVVLCPEHVRTLSRDGFSKQQIREFLFESTAIPKKVFDEGHGEGSAYLHLYQEVVVDGEPCYRKFAHPGQIHIVVAGGTAGKFSAVLGSWATGPRGSQIVTYPVEEAHATG